MKKLLIPSLILLFTSCLPSSKSHSEIIELPIVTQDGFGNFFQRYGIITAEPVSDTFWSKTHVPVEGIPEDWDDTVIKQIWFDAHQFVYQNFIAGNIDTARFEDLKKSWNFDPEKASYSKEPIKSFTHITLNTDKNGKLFYKIDTDNDRDFSDEEIFATSNESNLLGSEGSVTHTLKYETIRNGEITELETLFEIKPHVLGLLNSHPVHFTTEFKGRSIQISNGFQSTEFNSTSDLLVGEQDSTLSPTPIQINEYLVIDDNTYQNLGVNANKMVLRLRKFPEDTLLYSTQIGFLAKPFTGLEFTTKEQISLNDYKGKFVYLDFWGSWCAPCIEEMPSHLEAYAKLDKANIEFLGIAKDSPEPLRKTLDKFSIDWPQILSDDIPEKYRIIGYPTSYLINPKGLIVAKNLRGSNLSDTLAYYIKGYFSN